MGDDVLADVLAGLAVQLPVFAVGAAGIGLAVARRRRHPRAARLAAAGLAVLLAHAAAGPVLTVWLPRALIRQGQHVAAVGAVTQAVAAARSAVLAAGLVLLVMAVFAGRSHEPES
jgi:hypothetical protein